MTHPELLIDFIIKFIFKLIFAIAIWSVLVHKFSWYHPLFLTVILDTTSIILRSNMQDKVLPEIISILITVTLYHKVFLPITYPKRIKSNEHHKPESDQQ